MKKEMTIFFLFDNSITCLHDSVPATEVEVFNRADFFESFITGGGDAPEVLRGHCAVYVPKPLGQDCIFVAGNGFDAERNGDRSHVLFVSNGEWREMQSMGEEREFPACGVVPSDVREQDILLPFEFFYLLLLIQTERRHGHRGGRRPQRGLCGA